MAERNTRTANSSPPGSVSVSQSSITTIVGNANNLNFHLARDRGGLAVGADREVIERAQRCLVLIVKPHASRHLIPSPIDQNPCAHWRKPMDMMRQG